MHKTILRLLTLSTAFCFSQHIFAQSPFSDSTLNLGRTQLRKEFTQSIAIKGEDLEKMPFSNLNEAIKAWLFGIYTNGNTLLYVIDGIVINDINSYSVYDIKEITLLQNALGQVNGANGQQQILLVSTRQGGPQKKGLTVAGQSFLVKQDVQKGQSSESNFYHQYHLSAYNNGKNIQYGASLNYLRDVSPGTRGGAFKANTPDNFDRIRLNAWFTAKLSAQHEFYARLNVTPQFNDAESTVTTSNDILNYKTNAKQWGYNPTLGLRSTFFEGLTNDFSASYLNGRSKLHLDRTIQTYLPSSPVSTNYLQAETIIKMQQVVLNDRLAYTTKLRDWQFEPGIDFSFRYTKTSSDNASVTYNNNFPVGANGASTWQENRYFSITPSVSFSYKHLFNLQGGFLANLVTYKRPDVSDKKLFPFVTGTFNVLQPAANQRISLQVFGSYAQTPFAGDNAYTISPGVYVPDLSITLLYGPGPQINYNYLNENNWGWRAGTRVGFFNDRLTLSYNFDRRLFKGQVVVPIPSGYTVQTPEINTTGHFASVNARIVDNARVKWTSGVTAAAIKNKTTPAIPGYISQSTTGDFNNNTTSWTGGWVNRFSYERLSVGLDLVYYFTKDAYPGVNLDDKVNALAVQNVYVSYQLKYGSKTLEVYADSRNLVQDRDYKFNPLENKQYYGLGFKLSL